MFRLSDNFTAAQLGDMGRQVVFLGAVVEGRRGIPLWLFLLATGSSNTEILCIFSPLPTSDACFLSFQLLPEEKLPDVLFSLVLVLYHSIRNAEQAPVAWFCLNTSRGPAESPGHRCQAASLLHRSWAPLSLKCPLLPFSLRAFTSSRLLSV